MIKPGKQKGAERRWVLAGLERSSSFQEMTRLWFIRLDGGMTQNEKIKTRTCFSAVLTPAPTSQPHKKKRWFLTMFSIVSCSCWLKRHFLSQINPGIPFLKATCMFLREKSSEQESELLWDIIDLHQLQWHCKITTGKYLQANTKTTVCDVHNFSKRFVTEGDGYEGGKKKKKRSK